MRYSKGAEYIPKLKQRYGGTPIITSRHNSLATIGENEKITHTFNLGIHRRSAILTMKFPQRPFTEAPHNHLVFLQISSFNVPLVGQCDSNRTT